jgi:ribosome-associated protein
MRKMPSVGEYFLICSGMSRPQLEAISDNIVEKLRTCGARPWHVEGLQERSSWILIDYGDIVVHIFHDQTRKFYNLERLWGDAPQRRFRSLAAKRVSHVKRRRRPRKAKA